MNHFEFKGITENSRRDSREILKLSKDSYGIHHKISKTINKPSLMIRIQLQFFVFSLNLKLLLYYKHKMHTYHRKFI